MFLGALEGEQAGQIEVPFSFVGVRLLGRGASTLRVRLARDGEGGTLSLLALDEAGAPALSVQTLETRAIDSGQLNVAKPASQDALYELEWVQLQGASPDGSQPPVAATVLGEGDPRQAPGIELERYPDLAALESAVRDGVGASRARAGGREGAGTGGRRRRGAWPGGSEACRACL